MANWQQAVVTEKGLALIAKVTAGGKTLDITRAAIGRGKPSNTAQATALADLIGDVSLVTKVAQNNTTTVTVRITNATFSQLETISELGIFAKDPDAGEILFCVMVDDNPDKIQAATSSTLVAKTITMGIGYDNADNVTVTLSNTMWVTAEEVMSMISDELRKYGNRTHRIADATTARASAETLEVLADMLGNRVKAITGEPSWAANPANTIKGMNGAISNLTNLLGNLKSTNISDFVDAAKKVLNDNVVAALGVTYRLETNGFIKFGALGGFTIQWGYVTNVKSGRVTYLIKCNNGSLGVASTVGSLGKITEANVSDHDTTGFSYTCSDTTNMRWIIVGW